MCLCWGGAWGRQALEQATRVGGSEERKGETGRGVMESGATPRPETDGERDRETTETERRWSEEAAPRGRGCDPGRRRGRRTAWLGPRCREGAAAGRARGGGRLREDGIQGAAGGGAKGHGEREGQPDWSGERGQGVGTDGQPEAPGSGGTGDARRSWGAGGRRRRGRTDERAAGPTAERRGRRTGLRRHRRVPGRGGTFAGSGSVSQFRKREPEREAEGRAASPG